MPVAAHCCTTRHTGVADWRTRGHGCKAVIRWTLRATNLVIITNLMRTVLPVLIVLLSGCNRSVHMAADTSDEGSSTDSETWRGLKVCSPVSVW